MLMLSKEDRLVTMVIEINIGRIGLGKETHVELTRSENEIR